MKYILKRGFFLISQDTIGYEINANGASFTNEGETTAFLSIGEIKRSIAPGQVISWNTNDPNVIDQTVVNISFASGSGSVVVMKEFVTSNA